MTTLKPEVIKAAFNEIRIAAKGWNVAEDIDEVEQHIEKLEAENKRLKSENDSLRFLVNSIVANAPTVEPKPTDDPRKLSVQAMGFYWAARIIKGTLEKLDAQETSPSS